MKIAFLTEMGFTGKVPADHPNMRTEFAWMHALDADHHTFYGLDKLTGYDHVFIIFPKGQINYSTIGVKLGTIPNPYSQLLASDWLQKLKANNKKVYYVQEGPHWMYNELELADQIHFYNMLTSVDMVFAHNWSDVSYYIGLAAGTPIAVMPTLMIETLIKDFKWEPEEKTIIGGNFARWYGGFESFIVAGDFNVPVYGQTSHAMKEGENQLIQHLPRVQWVDWMKQLSTFKYAVHLMPTVAAGTFALNCAYFGIPCIGNDEVDTQNECHPKLGVNVRDVQGARKLVRKLRDDKEFYEQCSLEAKENYIKLYSVDKWKEKIIGILEHNGTK
jgi:hypothetical protein